MKGPQVGAQVGAGDYPARRLLGLRVDLAVIEDAHDVGVVERCRGANLAAKGVEILLVSEAFFGKNLDCDRILEAAMDPGPDLAHATEADRPFETEGSEFDHVIAAQGSPHTWSTARVIIRQGDM